MGKIPDSVKDPERWLWAMVILAVTMWASTTPWFSWVWFLVIAFGFLATGGIAYWIGRDTGWSRGYAKGYKNALDEQKRSRMYRPIRSI